jgi:serine protease AprX
LNGQQYTKPDVSAPGVDITSTIPVRYGYSYGYASGTSMATPHVSGTYALMLENNPALKPSEIKQILENTSVDLGPTGKDNDYGSGRINAYEALSSLPPVAAFYASPTSAKVKKEVHFYDTSSGIIKSWYWTFGDGTYSTAENPGHIYSKTGKYTVNLTIENAAGKNTKTMREYIAVK